MSDDPEPTVTDCAEDRQRLYRIDLHDDLPDAERIQALTEDARRFKFERDNAHAMTGRVRENWKRAEAGDKAILRRIWGLVDHKRKTLPMADLYAALQGETEAASIEPGQLLACNSRLHPDFANGQDVCCELPDSHACHRNGERTWTP